MSRSVAAQGESFSVAAGGFDPGCPVEIRLQPDGSLLDTIIADATGAVSGTVTLPVNATPGPSTVQAVASPQCEARVLGAVFEVTEARTGPAAAPAAADRGTPRGGTAGAGDTRGGLALTGTEVAGLGITGMALIAVGTLAVIAARKRRTATPA